MILLSLLMTISFCVVNSVCPHTEHIGASTVYAEENAGENQNDFMDNLLFMGDSMIYNPEDVAKTFSKHGHQVFAAMGATLPQFFGVTGHDVSIGMGGHRVRGNIANLEYNGIVILMGANDLANQKEEVVFEQYKKLLRELQFATMVPIYVLMIFPVNENYSRHYGNYREKNRRAQVLNEKLWRYCESTEGLYFVDATNGFISDDWQLLHDDGDGLHMDPKYYWLFYEDIMVAMSTLKDQVQGSLYNPSLHLERYWMFQWLREKLIPLNGQGIGREQ